jgi:hypothetical protein
MFCRHLTLSPPLCHESYRLIIRLSLCQYKSGTYDWMGSVLILIAGTQPKLFFAGTYTVPVHSLSYSCHGAVKFPSTLTTFLCTIFAWRIICGDKSMHLHVVIERYISAVNQDKISQDIPACEGILTGPTSESVASLLRELRP